MGWHPNTGHPRGAWGSLGATVKLTWTMGSGSPGGGDGDIASLHSGQVPLGPMQMSATSSACLWLDWGWSPLELTPLVVIPLLGRWRCLSSSGTMRSRGPVHQGSLPRGSGPGGYHPVIKGGICGYGQVHGATASIGHILQNHSFFGMVASFDVLMQNFYKVTQGNNEKVPSFAMRLEGPSNRSNSNAPGGWWTWRPNRTSMIASSMESKNSSATLSGTCAVPLVPLIHY